MSVMESPLEVLSRAATMVQDNANEARLTTKELPTTKWRRDRRIRTSEYHHSLSSSSMSPSSSPQSTPLQHHHHSSAHSPNTNGIVRPLSETTLNTIAETPLDMSVTSGIVKPRSPPPPYREPLPGSTFALAPRASVITQAPPKRDSSNKQNHISISDRENDDDSADSESNSEIDEHFRRSLGADYMNLFKKKSSPISANSKQQHQEQSSPTPKELVSSDEESTEQPSPKHRTTVTVNGESVGSSVDDHFAKALGDTWKKLQADKARNDD